MDETVFDWALASRIRDHLGEHQAIAERLKEQGPLVIGRLLNFYMTCPKGHDIPVDEEQRIDFRAKTVMITAYCPHPSCERTYKVVVWERR